jgi:hypothetical protein
MNPPSERRFPRLPLAKADAGASPSHPIRNRLLRLTAASPDLLAVIKQEGKV